MNSKRIVYGLLGVNTGVFLLWQNAKIQKEPSKMVFMMRNFTTSYGNVVKEGRWHTLLTASFSHTEIPHFLFNMIALYSFAPVMIYTLGARTFLKLYLGGGIAASVSSVALTSQTRGPVAANRGSCGASGSLMSMLASFGMLYPKHQIVMFVFPIQARYAVLGYALFDFYNASNASSRIDSLGHLGGLVYGAAFTYLRLFR